MNDEFDLRCPIHTLPLYECKECSDLIHRNAYKERRELRVKEMIEYLRHKERAYRERDVLNENHRVGGVVYLIGMIQQGHITMEKALQILPAIQNPYSEYTVEFKIVEK